MKLRTRTTISLLALVLIVLSPAIAHSQSQPSSKATAKVGYINVMSQISAPGTPLVGPWQNILSNTLKTPNQKDLFIGVSLEVGLLTDTTVKSKMGVSDTSKADAGVEVRVLIDGALAQPGVIVFGR